MAHGNEDTRNPYLRDLEILRAIWTERLQEDEEVFLVQRLAQTFVCVGLLISPATFVRWFGSKLAARPGRKHAIELYVLFKVTLMVNLLFSAKVGVLSGVIAALSLADLCTNLSGFVLLRNYWKKSASATRSIILLGFNFFELCSAFGILYLATESVGTAAGGVVREPLSILYFSVITSATVGYGDLTPINPVGHFLVILQVTISLAFVAVVLATFVSKLSPSDSRA